MINLRPNDILYLDRLQRDYENTINYYNDLAEHMKEWIPAIEQNKSFLTNTGLEHDIKDVMSKDKNKTTENFIEYIIWHLQKEYGLSSLDKYTETKILNKYIGYRFTNYNNKYDNLHYRDILKDISNELGIKDFDKAEYRDLKDRIINKLRYDWENEKIEIDKANKIKITDFGFRIGENWDDTICLLDTTVEFYSDIISALNYINTGELTLPEKAKTWLDSMCGYKNSKPSKEFYSVHKINILGIESLRFYKNRNLEIKFINEESKEKLIRVLKGEF